MVDPVLGIPHHELFVPFYLLLKNLEIAIEIIVRYMLSDAHEFFHSEHLTRMTILWRYFHLITSWILIHIISHCNDIIILFTRQNDFHISSIDKPKINFKGLHFIVLHESYFFYPVIIILVHDFNNRI